MELAPRLRSLDATRGLVVTLMIVVNTAAYLHYVNQFPAYPALLHAHWQGFTPADAVFPAFTFIIGVSIAISAREGVAPGVRAGRTVWRALRLLLIGVIISNLYWFADFDGSLFRPAGVLQRLAIVALAAGLLAIYVGPRTRLAIAVALLVLYWPLCLAPTPDGAPTNLDVRGQNFVAWFDRYVFGPYRYVTGPEGYDPEGILSTLPAIAQGLLGVSAGEYVLKNRGRPGAILKQALAGAAMIAAGVAWGFVFPIVKDIWTSTFVLVSSGVAMLVFAAAQALFDRAGPSAEPVPVLTAFGANAIAAYVLHILASIVLEGDLFKSPYYIVEGFAPQQAASLAPVFVFVALIWAAMAYLLRRGWIIKL